MMRDPKNNSLHCQLNRQLESRRQRKTLRILRRSNEAVKHQFSSNDYLDLSTYPPLRAIFSRYLEAETGLASTGSRLLSGNSSLAEAIEAEARHFWRHEDALITATGYEANVAIFSTIPQLGDTVLCDELIHASVHVALRASRALSKRFFKHNDMDHLHLLLTQEHGEHNVFIALETVYSMDGDLAPLQKVLDIVRDVCPRAKIILDEAHATGVFGSQGRGLTNQLDLESSPEILLRLHTFGKGLGGTGAIILCDTLVKQYLLNYSKGLIYSTFLSTPALCLMRASLHMLSSGQTIDLQDRLWCNIRYAQTKLRLLRSSALTIPSMVESPIIPILTPEPLILSVHLERQGFRVMPVRWPTVPKGQERIRICLRALMQHSDIDALIQILSSWRHEEQSVAKL